jgi:ABC-type antimicrobial peptide transport system permease subunit
MSLWQDLKFAVRLLIGQPSFTLVALVTLALGIGANAAMFSLVYGVLLKPLPFREPERLVQIWETNPLRNWTAATASPANLLDWRRRNRVFEEIAFYPGMDDRTPMYLHVSLSRTNEEPEALLFEIRPTDAPTYAAVCILLVCVGLAASYVPVRRALSVDPVTALRTD